METRPATVSLEREDTMNLTQIGAILAVIIAGPVLLAMVVWHGIEIFRSRTSRPQAGPNRTGVSKKIGRILRFTLSAAAAAVLLAGLAAAAWRPAGPGTPSDNPPDDGFAATFPDPALSSFAVGVRGRAGDPEVGRQVFLREDLACTACHGEPGSSRAGKYCPDLARVGRHDRDHLIRAVLLPSADLAPGFGSVALTLRDGSTVEGKFVRETADAVELRDGDGVRIIPRQQIAKRVNRSPMPDNFSRLMSEQDAADLVAFLQSLRGE
jgi:putative heme-binding domain-containing protein